ATPPASPHGRAPAPRRPGPGRPRAPPPGAPGARRARSPRPPAPAGRRIRPTGRRTPPAAARARYGEPRNARPTDFRSPVPEAGDTLESNSPGGKREFDALELPLVLRLVASLARTPPGARALLDLAPAFDEPAVRELLAETSEMWVFRARHGRLPLAGVEDIS